MTARDDLVATLAAFPDRLATAAGAAVAAAPPPPGEWSPREVVCHLVAVEAVVWHARLDLLWESPAEPRWSWVEPPPWDGPGSETLEAALELFRIRRSATLDRLARLDEAGWRRTGIHATYGRVDVERLLEIAVGHDREHLAALGGSA